MQAVKRGLNIFRQGNRSALTILISGLHQRINTLRFTCPQYSGDFPGNFLLIQHAGALRILNVMIDIGDSVCQANNPSFQCKGLLPAGVAVNSIQHLFRQVQPLAIFFKFFDYPYTLLVMAEALRVQLVESPFSRMAKRRMAQIMRQGDGFCQILVQ